MNNDEWRPPRRILRWFLLALVILIAVPIAVSALFFILRPVSRVYFPFYYPFFFPFGWIFAFFIIFWVLRMLFWPWGWRRRRDRGYRDEFHILRVRYARGEITKDQFDQMTHDLEEAKLKTQKST